MVLYRTWKDKSRVILTAKLECLNSVWSFLRHSMLGKKKKKGLWNAQDYKISLKWGDNTRYGVKDHNLLHLCLHLLKQSSFRKIGSIYFVTVFVDFNWNFRNKKAFCHSSFSCLCCAHSTTKIKLLFKLDDPVYSVQLLDWLSLSCQMPVMNSIQKENKLTLNLLNVLWILSISRKIWICFPDLLFLLSLSCSR